MQSGALLNHLSQGNALLQLLQTKPSASMCLCSLWQALHLGQVGCNVEWLRMSVSSPMYWASANRGGIISKASRVHSSTCTVHITCHSVLHPLLPCCSGSDHNFSMAFGMLSTISAHASMPQHQPFAEKT